MESALDSVRKGIPFKLYIITDRVRCSPRSLYDVIHGLLDAGVSAIQLREKDLSDAEFINLGKPIAKLCRTYAAQLFINSRITIAVELGADGVHLPGDSASVEEVFPHADNRLIVGCSVHNRDEARTRELEGADFLTYSPIYPTASKPGYGPAVGLVNLHNAAERVKIPIFALGGVTPERVPECIGAGAYGVAVMSSVMSPETGLQNTGAYLRQLSRVQHIVGA